MVESELSKALFVGVKSGWKLERNAKREVEH